MTLNQFDVNEKTWSDWDEPARDAFNYVFDTMTCNPRLFMHPGASIVTSEHWRTTAWNAAWLMADKMMGSEVLSIVTDGDEDTRTEIMRSPSGTLQ